MNWRKGAVYKSWYGSSRKGLAALPSIYLGSGLVDDLGTFFYFAPATKERKPGMVRMLPKMVGYCFDFFKGSL